jgi:cytochrome P450
VTTTASEFDSYLAALRDIRSRGQVSYSEKQQCWLVVGHPEVNQLLAEPKVFSSDLTAIAPAQEDFQLFRKGNFVGMDDPHHRRLRGMVSQAFTPKVIANLEPRIAQLTTDLLDQAGDRFDLVDALAYPLPVIVIADMLGVPASDQDTFRGWADTMLGQDLDRPISEIRDESVRAIAPVVKEMNEYLLEFIRSRRANPVEDLTSRLVRVEVDGERLDDQEIVGFVGLLLLAGYITTTATLGNSIVTLAENPDAVAEVRADLTLLPQAIEEVLRLRTPFPRLARMTVTDVELGGVLIPANQMVLPQLTGANRDERVFPDPDRFDPRRDNKHVTFGHGIHFCLGAPLARLEARVALRLMLERYADIEVADEVEFRDPWTMVAVTKLPLAVLAA